MLRKLVVLVAGLANLLLEIVKKETTDTGHAWLSIVLILVMFSTSCLRMRWKVKFHFCMVTITEVEDPGAIVQHFLEQKYLITAIVGHSKGDNVMLFYASKTSYKRSSKMDVWMHRCKR